MAVLEAEISPKLLTYEDYLTEGVVYGRYDIIDGVRYFMPNPTPLHQEIALNIAEMFRAYQRQTKRGRAFMAPRDILVKVNPCEPVSLTCCSSVTNTSVGSPFPTLRLLDKRRNWSWKSFQTAIPGKCDLLKSVIIAL